MRNPKPERQNKHIERTNISKVCSKTLRLDSYYEMKQRIREINSGKYKELTLGNVMLVLLQRRVGERMLRCSSPLQAFKSDEIPSPSAKSYANYTTSGYAAKLPKLNNRGKMSLAQADSNIEKNKQKSGLINFHEEDQPSAIDDLEVPEKISYKDRLQEKLMQ